MSDRNSNAGIYRLVGGVAAVLHILLFWHDTAHPAGFMRADRAQQRFDCIRALLGHAQGAAGLKEVLVRQGNIGDYGIHAVLYQAGGYLLVIAAQVLLAIIAAVCVTRLAMTASKSRSVSVASGIAYAVLPQSLAFPHQLLSEAWAVPMLIFGVTAFVAALESRDRWHTWLFSGLAFGLAGLVRPALIPLPIVAVGLALLQSRRTLSSTRLVSFAVVGLLPYLLWSSFMLSASGRFGLGESSQDLGLNLSQSTAKVLLSEGIGTQDGGPPSWLPERLSLPQYAGYVMGHPAGFANLYAKNLLVMTADSGIGRLYVDVLGFGAEERVQLLHPVYGWRAQLTNHGPWAMIRAVFQVAPGTVAAGLLGALAFAFLTLGTVAGYAGLLSSTSPLRRPEAPPSQRWLLAFLLLLPPYVLATSQVVAYAPSRLRSQAEFAWVILGCVGWAWMRRYLLHRAVDRDAGRL